MSPLDWIRCGKSTINFFLLRETAKDRSDPPNIEFKECTLVLAGSHRVSLSAESTARPSVKDHFD